jgi:N-acetylglucosaminyl-diphospho-decaprenol L-rhamnosyltransferase
MHSIVSFSIVSHGQGGLLKNLLNDLSKIEDKVFEVIITINIPEDDFYTTGYKYPVKVIRNQKPKGFGANHNSAFKVATGMYFAVVNPDIRCFSFNLLELVANFNNSRIGVVAPVVFDENGRYQDSARKRPTALSILRRFLSKNTIYDYPLDSVAMNVDWVAGMFVLFRRNVFKSVCGFDDNRFYMYYEDADICLRIRAKGWLVVVDPKVPVVHSARRDSHKKIKFLYWHVTSIIRLLSGF